MLYLKIKVIKDFTFCHHFGDDEEYTFKEGQWVMLRIEDNGVRLEFKPNYYSCTMDISKFRGYLEGVE